MKKLAFALALTLWLLPFPALAATSAPMAEGFALETEAVIEGMNQRSWAQGYAPTVSGDTLTICLPVSCERAVGQIKATLTMDDESVSPLRTQRMSARFRASKGVYAICLSLRLHKPRANGDYSGAVRVEGADADGQPISTDFPILVRIRDGETRADALRPALSDVAAELRVGEAATIRATLTNASRLAAMTDVRLIVSDPSGDVLPGGSNLLPLPDLMPGERCEIAYPVIVRADAKVAPHALTFELRYAALGQAANWEERFTLPIGQDIRLEQGGVQMAASVIQGDTASLTLPLMNMGRGELRNVLATLALPGVVERQSVLVGTLAPGESKSAKLTFSPGKDVLGDVTGEILVQCEDDWANRESLTLPVSLTVEVPAPAASVVAENGESEAPRPWLTYALGGGCGALLLLLAAQGALLRRKIRRMEEERL